MIFFSNYINNLHAGGGTSIMSGMELALKTIRDRKISNKVTSVFLLSDGQDKGAEDQLKHALAK
jgi:Mg-chelatase subunit ChlD